MDFLDFEVAPEIENLSTASFRLSDWTSCKLGGLDALCMNFSVPTPEGFLLNKIFRSTRRLYIRHDAQHPIMVRGTVRGSVSTDP